MLSSTHLHKVFGVVFCLGALASLSQAAVANATTGYVFQGLPGTDSRDGDFGYVAHLFTNGEFTCGGAILSDDRVVTAASCVTTCGSDGKAADIDVKTVKVAFGTKYKSGMKMRKVSSVVHYDMYNCRTHENNIAVITVEGTIDLNKKIKPVKLDQQAVVDHSTLTLVGLGPPGTNQNLKQLPVSMISKEECSKSSGITLTDPPALVCTIDGDKKLFPCTTQEGAPLFRVGANGASELAGIRSFFFNKATASCTTQQFTNTYIRPSYYSKFLNMATGIPESDLMTLVPKA
ncbi:hypothetical protein IWQ60_004540 [Tieghemiomyces parasiticus]|uniref:Peptidase S1 domain-containing protein n=1 Tax=Tieghemiomyces parasiticus TaxID=78921 RepID=A0A9W8DVF0_9FUNG|nr:hypothetical protein IWQ60_004540 [Tieghemiomyces parasiticus]